MPNTEYSNFKELEKNEVGNYTIECIDKGSHIIIIAPHGGRIEPRTDTIAKTIAYQNFNYYGFISERGKIKARKNMHITSHKFDEPKALELVGKSEIVIAIHGCKNLHSQRSNKKEIFIGGLNKDLKTKLEKVLKESSLHVSFLRKFAGEEEDNICNRGSTKAGVQFELTSSFRNDGELCRIFISTVRNFLETNAL